jgi:ectoine hydroxylase-related dioxygenase (phytanoyl-CoA dioxygenase family)
VALDGVPAEVSLRFVAGSHAWGRLFAPRYFKDGSAYDGADAYEPVPDIDAAPETYRVVSWPLEPGDALAFDFRTLHGAPGNPSAGRRRGFAARWFGDDARYVERPQPPSPPYPEMGLELEPGAPMPEDWFPVVWPAPAPIEERS